MGKTLATILLGTVVSLTGCELTPVAREIGLGLMIHGAKEKISHELNPNETNVNIYGQGGQGQGNQGTDPFMPQMKQIRGWIPPPPSFVFLKAEDKNNDGYYGRDDFIGLGTYFECKKLGKGYLLGCGAIWTNIKGRNISLRLKDTKTEKLLAVKDLGMMKKDNCYSFSGISIKKTIENHGIQSYTLEWYVDGKKIPTRNTEFLVDYGKKEKIEENKEKENE